jgi:hypothetical protein
MALSTVTADMFTRAVGELLSVRPRREIVVTGLTAPRGLAPFSYALGATVGVPVRPGGPGVGDADDVTTGRLVLLHDPAGQPGWEGTVRMVSYVTAELEPDLAGDTLLPEVGWSWLVDALECCGADHLALAGTVTLTSSTRFGGLAGPPPAADVEIRASWTPAGGDGLDRHMEAWCTLLASAAGLPPPGVSALRP